MKHQTLSFLVALATLSATPLAYAQWKDGEEPPTPDPSRPALGTWIGSVSWTDRPVSYVWDIFPSGDFSSGRLGRGAFGGGHWSQDGAHLSLKYEDGFRYDGDINGGAYSGVVSLSNGQRFGTFSMNRAPTKPAPPEEAP